MTNGRKMTARIPVTPEVHQMYKDMTHGADVTFDDLLRFLAEEHDIKPDDRQAALGWGLSMKERLEKWSKQHKDSE